MRGAIVAIILVNPPPAAFERFVFSRIPPGEAFDRSDLRRRGTISRINDISGDGMVNHDQDDEQKTLASVAIKAEGIEQMSKR